MTLCDQNNNMILGGKEYLKNKYFVSNIAFLIYQAGTQALLVTHNFVHLYM